MPLAAGSKLGPYEIAALIGAGGMGEVYRARDPRLNRDVAIKISAAQFTERFEREARAVAALNHPNICTLHDVGPNYLVMEFIEGEAPQGPLPLDEALRIARQIAAALEEAHEKGITHRDLKPANIKIKPDGTVKVLDFGLAKFSPAETDATPTENSPTLSMAATQMGVILGTAGYMSPEQARGKKADKRADIWAFGVMLYELLAGKRLFDGEDVSHIMAAVILQPPKLDDVPFEVRKLLRRCLEKDPKNRLRDIGDVWQLLEEAPPPAVGRDEVPPQGMALPHRGWGRWVLGAISAILLLGLGAAAAWIYKPSLPQTITKFPIALPEGQAFTTFQRAHLALSPDGTQMAYVANRRLYVRNMSELEPRLIPGTDLGGNISDPVFSPDGKTLAFLEPADLTLKRIAVSGGAAVTICPVPGGTDGVSWGPDGIVFALPGKILRVSPNGGQPETLVTLKDNEQVEGPQMLPGGQAVLFTLASGAGVTTAAWDKAQIIVQTLKSGTRKTLITGGSDARYLPTGHLVYALNGVLFATAFDLKNLAVIGGPVGIVEGVARGVTGSAHFAFSSTGSMIYVPGPVNGGASGQNVLGLVDRKGDVEPLKLLPPATYNFPRVSRDGKRVAYQIDDNSGASIWIYELSGASAPRRLTLPGTGSNRDPIWSSDSQRVAFQSDREGDLGIWWQPADGNAPAERLTKPDMGVSHIPDSWSPDGQRFSFTSVKNEGSSVWVYSLRDRKATVFAEVQKSSAARSVFSPDGKWIAYQVSDGQASHSFIQAYPSGATYPIPQDGNDHHPAWSPSGKELFYTAGQGQFGSVSVNTQPSVSFGSPVRALRVGFSTASNISVRTYDVMPDGQHFIGVVGAAQAQSGQAAPQIQVVLNWFEDVKQRAPGK